MRSSLDAYVTKYRKKSDSEWERGKIGEIKVGSNKILFWKPINTKLRKKSRPIQKWLDQQWKSSLVSE